MRRALLVLLLAACGGGKDAPPATLKPQTGGPLPVASHVETKKFASAALGVEKAVLVYLPAGYDAAKKYPVFYYLHGLTGNETNWTKGGDLQAQADAMHLQAIVVMPDGDDGFYTDSVTPRDYDACLKAGTGLFDATAAKTETCVKTAAYETYIVKDLVGWVDANYATNTAREGRAIAGLSMGGYGALALAMRHPDLFAAAASHSGVDSLLYKGPRPYVAGKEELIEKPAMMAMIPDPIVQWLFHIYGPDLANWKSHDPVTLAAALKPGQLALYLDVGSEDDLALDDRAKYLHDVLTAQHLEHEWYIGPGGHNMRFWRERLPFSLAFLVKHTTGA